MIEFSSFCVIIWTVLFYLLIELENMMESKLTSRSEESYIIDHWWSLEAEWTREANYSLMTLTCRQGEVWGPVHAGAERVGALTSFYKGKFKEYMYISKRRKSRYAINCHSDGNYDTHYNDFNCGNWTMEDSVSVVKTFFSMTARAVWMARGGLWQWGRDQTGQSGPAVFSSRNSHTQPAAYKIMPEWHHNHVGS